MKTMQRPFAVVLLVLSVLSAAGCAVAHRYPAYRGRVLEVGTDKPIEGAGVLAVYGYRQYSGIDVHDAYLGYQAVLTNTDGKFEIPAAWFTKLMPFSWFDDDVRITIYKKGYGNFPASFPFCGGSPGVSRGTPAKEGKTDPVLNKDQIPPGREVTFWLPKLETQEDRKAHNLLLVGTGIPYSELPPKGMTLEQFKELFGRY